MKKLITISLIAMTIPAFVLAAETPAPVPSTRPSPAVGSSLPSTGSSGTTVLPPTGSSYTTVGTTPSPAPVRTGTTGGVSISSSGSSISSGGSSGYTIYPISSVAYSASCPLLPSVVMQQGWMNDRAQVTKLQSFLKNTQELDVDVTGVYDEKTVDAIKEFQTMHASIILAPWNMTVPSGITGITTIKEINAIACKTPLTLTSSELALIKSYRDAVLASATVVPTAVVTVAQSTSTASSSTDVTASTDQTSNTASVGNLNIFQKFWNFIVSLFR